MIPPISTELIITHPPLPNLYLTPATREAAPGSGSGIRGYTAIDESLRVYGVGVSPRILKVPVTRALGHGGVHRRVHLSSLVDGPPSAP